MTTFTVGEEVLYEDERYVVSTIDSGGGRYRLLATTPDGARIVWAAASTLAKIERYTRSKDDTGRFTRG